MSTLFASFPSNRRRGTCAAAILLLAAPLPLVFASPAPEPYIDAQIELRGWNREECVTVGVSEEGGLSL